MRQTFSQSERSRTVIPGMIAIWLLAAAPVLVSASGLPEAQADRHGLDPQRLERLDAALSAAIEREQLPGAVMLVARDGRTVHRFAGGLLDPEGDEPMSEEAIFRIYSMTKPLVSVAAMILVEEGRMQLTDPVSRHLPAFSEMRVSRPELAAYGRVVYRETPATRAMTVQDLLRHTSGLAYGELTQNPAVQAGYAEALAFQPGVIPFDSRSATPDAQVEGVAKVPLVHEPGTAWEYSLSSDILGRVVEAVSGQRLEEFMAERIFEPLDMIDTGFHLTEDRLPRLAQAFSVDPDSGQSIPLMDVGAPPANASGGAGAVSTAADYLRFSQMLLNGGELDGVRILSPTTVKLMTADHIGDRISAEMSPGELLIGVPGYGFGLGFATRLQDGIAGVPGSSGEYMWAGFAGTYFWVDPEERLTAVFMSQAPSPERAYFRRLVKQLVHQAIID